MKTIKLLISSAAALVIFSACCQKHTISANFAGLDNDTVIVQTMPLNVQGEVVMDTIVAQNGKFTYDMTDTIDMYIYLVFPKKAIDIMGGKRQTLQMVPFMVVKPGEKFTVKGNMEEVGYVQYSVKEAGFNQQYADFRESYKELALKADGLDVVLDMESQKEDGPEKDAMMQKTLDERQDYLIQVMQMRKDHIASNPSSDLAAYFTTQLSIDEVSEYYAKLTDEAKNGLFSVRLANIQSRLEAYQEVLKAKENIVEGGVAPDFTLKDMDGNDVSLSQFKNTYVVLDFWGSWCGWCIKGAPEMKKYSEKYAGKVQFIGIACHDTDAKWRAAVAENGMNWLQLFNGEDSSDITRRYAIEGYPTKLILGKDLKILKIVVGESPEFYEALDKLPK